MNTQDPVQKFYQVIQEAGLIAEMTPMIVRQLQDGAVLIDKPSLVVKFQENAVIDAQIVPNAPVTSSEAPQAIPVVEIAPNEGTTE